MVTVNAPCLVINFVHAVAISTIMNVIFNHKITQVGTKAWQNNLNYLTTKRKDYIIRHVLNTGSVRDVLEPPAKQTLTVLSEAVLGKPLSVLGRVLCKIKLKPINLQIQVHLLKFCREVIFIIIIHFVLFFPQQIFISVMWHGGLSVFVRRADLREKPVRRARAS